ncbi:MAG: hypothetical protein E7417_01305 [Ruminococcaceae bacterium]|nr:hypothetical protein [Oscillospiraceae bacterium]
MNHFIYIKDLLAVKTNLDKFSWSYGTVEKNSKQEDFDRCKVKVYVRIVPDKEVPVCSGDKFSFFTVDKESSTIYYSRRFFGAVNLCYSLRIDGNSIYMICGKNYYRLVRGRIMNIHSVGYILSDVVEGILLNNGLCTIYCSAVSFKDRAVCLFGAPNTGKTLTGLLLCNKHGGKLVSEDFAVTDGENIWGAPMTNTHRNYAGIDGANDKVEIEVNSVKVSDVVIIQKGKNLLSDEKDFIKVKSLNRYGLGYVRSPSLIALGYYNHEFDIFKMSDKENEILESLVKNHGFLAVSSENVLDFADSIMDNIRR